MPGDIGKLVDLLKTDVRKRRLGTNAFDQSVIQVDSAACLPLPAAMMLDKYRTSLYETRHTLAMCRAIHGDLNPRNFLLDGAENIHIIDFSTFGPGPLVKDFARIECETLLRLCKGLLPSESVSLYGSLFSGDICDSAGVLASLPLRSAAAIALKCIAVIRRFAKNYGKTPSAPSDYNFNLDYAIAASATACRLCLFKEYLSVEQAIPAYLYASFSLSYAAKLIGT
jgi:serine/threonine protein kinase